MRRSDPTDAKKRYFRSLDRVLNLNGAWYFAAREGELGPFPTRAAAEREVLKFLAEREHLRNFEAKRRQVRDVARLNKHERVRHQLDQLVDTDELVLTLEDDLLI